MIADILPELEGYYAEYVAAIARLEGERANIGGAWRGVLGSTRLGADSCNDRFAEDVRLCLAAFAQVGPGSAEAERVMRFVLDKGQSERQNEEQNDPAGLMMEAVQGYLLPLAALLDARGAEEILKQYYPKSAMKRLLPAQKELVKALRAKAKG